MKYPVHHDMVVAMLWSRQQALAELLDGLALVVATMALRPGEGAAPALQPRDGGIERPPARE